MDVKKPELKSLYYDKEVEKIPPLNGKTIANTGTTLNTGFNAAKTVAEKGARILSLNRKTYRSNKSYHTLNEGVQKANFIVN